MSKYGIFSTIIRDQKHLCAALAELGFTEVEVHDEAKSLIGYHGDTRPEKANIIIRRAHIGSASNDVGFAKQEDGTYRAIISDYDRHRFDDTWMGQLKQGYTVQRHLAVARAKGHVLLGREVVKGKVMLRFGAR